MNRNALKNYAPQARREFIQAVTDRAALFGLTAKKTEPMTEKGDAVLIAGKPFPKSVGEKRKRLEARIKKYGFERTMEAMAYTWFNRLVALRYMEIHEYLEHGYRVLSHPAGHNQPELLEHAEHVELAGLDKQKVIALKLDGTKEEELYRHVLLAQCNALNKAMPFLFEKIDDETELLLPDNLLHSDSLIRKLVGEIDEEDWQQVEIIGWLYQFYISERKDEVIGKVVASEDIPAATQLFTPNWIVKYLVQNTLGRQWLATYSQSALRQQMEYYIEPAEQTPEVQEQLKAITPTSLNPEELTLLDPACGSGHILVEAYDLFKAIYTERGYRAKDIPALILQKNLFGLEIDDRAAQLAAFALMMKARAGDRRIFDGEAKPNIVAIQESKGLNAADLTHTLNAPAPSVAEGRVSQVDIACLLDLFENAKTFGSLIQIPPKLTAKLPEIEKRVDDVLKFGDLTHASVHVLKPMLQQARLLARQCDAVVANPPYMGNRFYNSSLKEFINVNYSDAKADICTAFIERGIAFAKRTGLLGHITMQSWMFLSSFEEFRQSLLQDNSLRCMAHLGPHAFPEIGGQVVQVTAFTAAPPAMPHFRGSYRRLVEGSSDEKQQQFSKAITYTPSALEFAKIPGSPVAYWVSPAFRAAYEGAFALKTKGDTRQGMATSDNTRFLRFWYEVAFCNISFFNATREQAKRSGCRWYPYNKGGEFRKWYGNQGHVVNWHNDGYELLEYAAELYGSPTRTIKSISEYFKPSVSWSKVTVKGFSARAYPVGFIFDVAGCCVFFDDDLFRSWTIAFLNSNIVTRLLEAIAPSINFEAGHVALLPVKSVWQDMAKSLPSADAIDLAKADWDSFETSWDFLTLPVLKHSAESLFRSQELADAECQRRFVQMRTLEEENNRLFIEAYGLQDELSPEVPDDQITIYRPDRQDDIKRLLSYSIGCMMGRYSLDKPRLIYAHSGNQEFDPSQYTTFRADDDGIIPLLEADWDIRDDATNRCVEFIGVAWPKEHLAENLKLVADSLGPNDGEQPRDTIRRYLATGFYKHHLSMYKKRPIYWLFSSGKQRAFQCLVYLHRYNEGTLARMRTEYVIRLLGKMTGRLQQLEDDIPAASTTSNRRKLEKERDKIKKQLSELQEFDAKLRHYADQRIKLDLDDGVKVNYGKFSDPEYGDILAEVKAICGTKDED